VTCWPHKKVVKKLLNFKSGKNTTKCGQNEKGKDSS
jgi:hypothetical protein